MDDHRSDLEIAETHLREGRIAEAAALYGRVLSANADCVEALFQIGTLALRSGDARAAVPLLERAARLAPQVGDVWNNLGAARKESGDRAGAAAAWRTALEVDDRSAGPIANLAELALEQGDQDLATKLYGQCLERDPSDSTSAFALGDLLMERGQYFGAEECFLLAHRLDHAAGDLGERIRLLSQLALSRLKQDKLVSAEGLYRLIIGQMPTLAGMWANLSYVLERQGRIDEAIETARQALVLEPGLSMGINNLAVALRAAHRVDEAADIFERAFATGFDQPLSRFNHATMRLQQGRYREGWSGYEQRHGAFGAELVGTGARRLTCGDSGSLVGQTIVVRTEQGYGDTLQFSRFLPEFARRTGARVLWECPDELRSLARTAPPGGQALTEVAEFVPVGGPFPAHDAWIPLGSLPGWLDVSLEQIEAAALGRNDASAAVPYMAAEVNTRNEWRTRLDNLAETGCGDRSATRPRIGLVWQGNPAQAQDIHRSCRLRHLEPLLADDRFVWFSLQKGEVGERQLIGLDQPHLIPLGPELRDFADTAAVLTELDLLITVDTSVAHLAGSLGTDVWCLLCHTPDWRWHMDRTDCPWYPTMRLFRQPKFGDWPSVAASVQSALEHWLTERTPSRREAA
jgi:tetratricopeptide (TPR) repeat protein